MVLVYVGSSGGWLFYTKMPWFRFLNNERLTLIRSSRIPILHFCISIACERASNRSGFAVFSICFDVL